MKITDEGYAIIETDTHIGRWVQESKRLDHDLTVEGHILPLLKPNFRICDAGANIGSHTIRYAQAVPEGFVYAFEPNPVAFECLAHNLKNYQNTECFKLALADKCAAVSLAVDTNVGASHLIRGKGGYVECIQLDLMRFTRLDFFKLDVEGYELFALKGAEQTIRRCNPIILVEMNAGTLARNGVRYQDIFEFLAGLGYQWKPFAQNCDLLNEPQYDLLATPK